MQYQTFSGTDLKEALGAVRAAFGPDALIGPTRHINVPGHGGFPELRVEVQAAPSTPQNPHWPFASALHPQGKRAAGATAAPVIAKGAPRARRFEAAADEPSERLRVESPTLSRMEAQINELRFMVESLKAQLPSKQRALSLLAVLGIDGSAARHLSGRIGKAKSDQEIAEKLAARLDKALVDSVSILDSGKPELVACVGPTGSGKTTTLAKMAAQARLDHGRSVAVVCLDHFRVGALDQWQRYAKLMNIPVFAPQTPDELGAVFASNPADLILVDTPSVGSSADPAMRAFSDVSHLARRAVHVLLLLPTWLRGNDAERLVHQYGHLSPTGLVGTKLDESDTLGGLVQASITGELPITFLSRGPRVPEHLERAEKRAVIEQLLSRLSTP
jgi:flagellar biosynthesis protein FlhF